MCATSFCSLPNNHVGAYFSPRLSAMVRNWSSKWICSSRDTSSLQVTNCKKKHHRTRAILWLPNSRTSDWAVSFHEFVEAHPHYFGAYSKYEGAYPHYFGAYPYLFWSIPSLFWSLPSLLWSLPSFMLVPAVTLVEPILTILVLALREYAFPQMSCIRVVASLTFWTILA